jgi:hypothetical protein
MENLAKAVGRKLQAYLTTHMYSMTLIGSIKRLDIGSDRINCAMVAGKSTVVPPASTFEEGKNNQSESSSV